MPVSAKALGEELPSRVVEITPRMTLAYAAGIGELGPRTFDDAGSEPLVAPPSFCTSLEWAVFGGDSRVSLLGLELDEAVRAVHVEQDSAFHRTIRPGDRLRTACRIVAIRGTRAGALVRVRLSTLEADSGEPVVTSWCASIYRDVGVDGEGGTVEDPPRSPSPSAPPTQQVALPVPQEAAHVYSECAGIWNPIHTERKKALAAGLPGIILHGSATWALAGRELGRVHADGEPERLLRLRGRFKAPVIPGTTITLLHDVGASAEEVHFMLRNAAGQTAIADGFAQLEPRRADSRS